jgi:hypothetical protein
MRYVNLGGIQLVLDNGKGYVVRQNAQKVHIAHRKLLEHCNVVRRVPANSPRLSLCPVVAVLDWVGARKAGHIQTEKSHAKNSGVLGGGSGHGIGQLSTVIIALADDGCT